MPPLVSWSYQRTPAADSPEARLTTDFLVRKEWLV
jgi:coproporphyrinogen III oxidase